MRYNDSSGNHSCEGRNDSDDNEGSEGSNGIDDSEGSNDNGGAITTMVTKIAMVAKATMTAIQGMTEKNEEKTETSGMMVGTMPPL